MRIYFRFQNKKYDDIHLLKSKKKKYEPQISSLKCNQQCTPYLFRDDNNSSKVWLIPLKISKHKQNCGWFFCKQTKKIRLTLFELKS